jgi:hypothetical protein
MNKFNLFFLLSLIIVLGSCCETWDCERGRGASVTREIYLQPFNSFDLNGSGDVYLYKGEEQRVVVEGQENILDLLEERVDNDHWEINFRECINNHDKLVFHITLPEIRFASISGSGKIVSLDTLSGTEMTFNMYGSGDINVKVDANLVRAAISGSGNILMGGVANEGELRISGSGNVKAFDLKTRVARAIISGSGNIEVFAENDLVATISGSGNIRYKGSPSVDSNISGSGTVRKVN